MIDTNLKICCIKLSLATRLIAMIGLMTSVLVFTQVFSDLLEHDANQGTVSILLGLDVDNLLIPKNSQLTYKLCYLFFALFTALANALLIWGSIVEIPYFAYPWLACEVIMFGLQIASIVIISINWAEKETTDKWLTLFAICNLFVILYFWTVVFCAQRAWKKQRNEKENSSISTLSSSGNDTVDVVFEPPSEKAIDV